MPDRSAGMPFRFVSCMELRESLGKRAQDVHRLLEIIEEVPPDSMYDHPTVITCGIPIPRNYTPTTLRAGWHGMRKTESLVSGWES